MTYVASALATGDVHEVLVGENPTYLPVLIEYNKHFSI